jgi:hypothetical protein
MSDSNDFQTSTQQAQAVTEILNSEGISQHVDHDPYAPFKRRGQSDEDTVNNFVDAANSINDRTSRSPSTRTESRYEPSHEDTDPAPERMPSRFQSHDDVRSAANWLTNEITAVDEAYRQGLVSDEQYHHALARANELANEIRAGDLSVREQQIAARDHVESIHRQIGELVPEWNDQQGRAKVQAQLMGLAKEYGVPAEIMMQISDPQTIAGIHSLFKDLQGLRNQRARQLRQIKARQAESRKNNSRETAGYQSIQDQVNGVADILRSAGGF